MSTVDFLPLPQPAPVEDKLAALTSLPLFMKSLPAEDSNDIALDALQSLVYDGTPDEIAQNFKEQGSDYFKGKRYREALGFYTQGIDAKPTDLSLQEALFCNRAACNLELKNYGSAIRDCSKALGINERSSKAYYRSSLALLALDRVDEALDCCERCLAFDPDNEGMKRVYERARNMKSEKDRKDQEKLEKSRKDQEIQRRLKVALGERNIIVILQPQDAGADNSLTPHFDVEDESRLVVPTFFLYPQHATSDFIPDFVENTQFVAHLSRMFPPEAPAPDWDKKGEYISSQLVVYATTHQGRLLKIGKKMTMRDVLNAAKEKAGEARDGLELKHGCISFVVLPKGDVEKTWIDEYKRSRDEV